MAVTAPLPSFGPWRLRLAASSPGLGLIIEGLGDEADAVAPADYVNDVLLTEDHREAFFTLIDHAGLVICRNVRGDDRSHRDVRGRSSRGRLSPGEFYHHDGCSGPTKPRVLEIRCPYQVVARHTATSIAPFAAVIDAMVRALPPRLRRDGELAAWYAAFTDGAPPAEDQWDDVQGTVNRTLRRAMSAEDTRAYFRDVDDLAGAYREAWQMGESRFIGNDHAGPTMQHRRAYLEPHTGGRPNGHLLKRWPAGPELHADEPDGPREACQR